MSNADDNGFCLGRHYDPIKDRLSDYVFAPDVSNILINGPPGSGKSNLIILNTALLHRPLVIEDQKCELSTVAGRLLARKRYGGFQPINAWNLFAAEHPHVHDAGWNPCRDIKRDNPHFLDDVRGLMLAINASHGLGGNNAYFHDGATEAGVPILLDILRKHADGHLGMFRDVLAQPYAMAKDGPIGLLKFYIQLAAGGDDLVASLASRFAEGERSNREVITTLRQESVCIDSPAIRLSLQGPGIDWPELKNSARSLAFITPSDKLQSHKGYRRMFWQTALRELMRAPRNGRFPPAMMIIDEFPALGFMREFISAAATARGHGLRMTVVVQDFSQLEEIYSKQWQTWVTTATCVASFAPRSMFTAEYLSKLCGEKIVKKRSGTGLAPNGFGLGARDSFGREFQHEARKLFEPWQLMQMPPGRMLVLVTGLPPFFTQVENYWESKFAHLFAPNPYHPPTRGRR